MTKLTGRQRLTRQARGQDVDEVPTLGGWIGGARNLATLAGMVKAHKALGTDGLINSVIHRDLAQLRTGQVLEEAFTNIEPEVLLAAAGALPDSDKEVPPENLQVAYGHAKRVPFGRRRDNSWERWPGTEEE